MKVAAVTGLAAHASRLRASGGTTPDAMSRAAGGST